MSVCPNCKATLSCGCQKKKASNGVVVCRSCVTKYERSLQEQKPQTQPTKVEPKLNAWGRDRYKNLH